MPDEVSPPGMLSSSTHREWHAEQREDEIGAGKVSRPRGAMARTPPWAMAQAARKTPPMRIRRVPPWLEGLPVNGMPAWCLPSHSGAP